jgi:hypothetical protein
MGSAVLVTREVRIPDAEPCVQDVAIAATAKDTSATTRTRPGRERHTVNVADALGSSSENGPTRRTISPVGAHAK